ncbi:MAG: ParB/RepB/Spo0J family partition protein [Clostridia bacterium]|nr:ParB/RepB/Spo0J family partition protein [Clostridia bacterium]
MLNKNIKSPVNIPVSKIHPFEGNPYKVQDNDEMNNLIGSIQEQGILTPIIIRPIENTDEYEVISGHRRLHATVKAGMKEVPAFIYAVTRDEAAIMLVDSNLHREYILPSERAFAYKLKAEALKHQGKRSDLTSVQVAPKLATEQIGVTESISKDTVKRYIRLTYLIPELLELVDEEKIALTPAVELSYLSDEEQYSLLGTIEEEDRTPSLSQAVRFKKLSQAGELSDESIETIMQEDKANQKPMFKVSMERLQKVAPKVKDKDFEDFVLKACEHYYRYLLRQRDRDSR